ncbi:MAG: WecB/TagA/CpsF family glycosyltransferase [Paracoccaceae bacterium]
MNFNFPDHTIRVNIPNRTTLLDAVRERLGTGRGFALATINLDHLVKLRTSASYRAIYAEQDLVVADGNPIVWLSYLAGNPVMLVPGSDILRPILKLAAEEQAPVGFFGSSPDVLTEAARRLSLEIPSLRLVWTGSPRMGFDPTGEEARAALDAMHVAGVRLCIVSLSAPRQEAFAAFGRSVTPEIGFCGFGAGLDFVVGEQVRAPLWMRKVALEWLWRALSAPRRLLPRYAACAAILPAEALDALRQRRG